MLIVKVALELLALIIVLVLVLSIVVAARRLRTEMRKALPPSDTDNLAHFDELLHQHDELHKGRPDE